MDKFGYIDRLNGMDTLPYWKDPPCNSITASEGSFFPPRAYTNSNIVYVYDKDLCRIMPLEYVKSTVKDGKHSIPNSVTSLIIMSPKIRKQTQTIIIFLTSA